MHRWSEPPQAIRLAGRKCPSSKPSGSVGVAVRLVKAKPFGAPSARLDQPPATASFTRPTCLRERPMKSPRRCRDQTQLDKRVLIEAVTTMTACPSGRCSAGSLGSARSRSNRPGTKSSNCPQDLAQRTRPRLEVHEMKRPLVAAILQGRCRSFTPEYVPRRRERQPPPCRCGRRAPRTTPSRAPCGCR